MRWWLAVLVLVLVAGAGGVGCGGGDSGDDATTGTEAVFTAPLPAPGAGKMRLTPDPPRAGERLTATMPITVEGKRVTTATVTCTAILSDRSVNREVNVRGATLTGGVARCVWVLPDSGTGEPLYVWVKASTAGGVASQDVQTCVGCAAELELAEGWVPNDLGFGWRAWSVNDRGQIAGSTNDTMGEESAVLWEQGEKRGLSQLPGTAASSANGISDHGQIVGWSDSPAVLWEKGEVRSLGTLGGSDAEATAVNERGQVVGWSLADANDDLSVHAFLWSSGGMLRLTTPANRKSNAVAINEAGEAVGLTWVGVTRDGSRTNQLAAFWRKGDRVDLPSLGGKQSAATDINDRGQIVGWSQATDGRQHGTLWQDGRPRDLGATFEPSAINNRGDIAGVCDRKDHQGDGQESYESSKACIAHIAPNGAVRIAVLPSPEGNDSVVVATDINNRGQFVGYQQDNCLGGCMTTEPTAYIWTRKRG